MIILALIIFISIAVAYATSSEYDRPFSIIMGASAGLVICAFVWYPAFGMTGGFYENYSEGERVGFVTKLSKKGFFWKTWEAQLQVGTGELAALQEPFSFSVADPELVEFLESSLGTANRVRITYSQWLVTPFRIGENSHVATGAEPIE